MCCSPLPRLVAPKPPCCRLPASGAPLHPSREVAVVIPGWPSPAASQHWSLPSSSAPAAAQEPWQLDASVHPKVSVTPKVICPGQCSYSGFWCLEPSMGELWVQDRLGWRKGVYGEQQHLLVLFEADLRHHSLGRSILFLLERAGSEVWNCLYYAYSWGDLLIES